jgi:AraC-like DNA-binding protein
MINKGLNSLAKKIPEEDIILAHVSDDIGAYQIKNSGKNEEIFSVKYDKSLIHFVFSLSGNIGLSSRSEKVIVTTSNFFMFTNPREDVTLDFKIPSGSKVFSLMMSMKELHGIFGSSFGSDQTVVNNFMESYKMKLLFNERELTPSIAVIAHQFFNGINRPSVQKIYQHGKVMEFLSLYMDSPNSKDEVQDQCPFVMDASEMERIKEARNIIIDKMISPPSLKELARMVGTNEFKLKVGFRSIFGTTVYGYLSDHRMELARKLLIVDKARIKEVAVEVGYSNPSHFIAAYKRKYGVTPKQHLKSMVA